MKKAIIVLAVALLLALAICLVSKADMNTRNRCSVLPGNETHTVGKGPGTELLVGIQHRRSYIDISLQLPLPSVPVPEWLREEYGSDLILVFAGTIRCRQ